ncbi:MAG TPA: purine-nucleoside phosphorylase, partial [Sphingobacteriaceae bacterium]|nr:purine-nucleoside phosphorylase [Sphingobacteriaceae bacterium]
DIQPVSIQEIVKVAMEAEPKMTLIIKQLLASLK